MSRPAMVAPRSPASLPQTTASRKPQDARYRHVQSLLGADRLWLTSDCGFATFADNPVASAARAQGKLAALAEAARQLRGG